jgi:excisionase family DNA binding protein
MTVAKTSELLTVAEAALRLGVSGPTVRRLIREEGLPAVTHPSGVRIDPAELDAWLHREDDAG